MIQDTFLRTFRNLHSFVPRHDGAFAAYLRQALNNRIKDEIRRTMSMPRRVELPDDERDRAASPLEEAIGREALQRYEGALERLGVEERDLVVMRIEMGLSYKELAALTDRPSDDAARMAVARALVRIATEMDDAT
jgi:RNA polymerase sigma-70 factor (ECF subfamily)